MGVFNYKVSINFNDNIKVKLTPEGESKYYAYFNTRNNMEKFNHWYDPNIIIPNPKIHQDGYYVFSFVEFITIFGKYIENNSYHGLFENNEFIIEES